ncbi:pyroglutamyl-peptidase I [Clostridium folliculivorans]|uniref:Pyrrolidone-carboxylate peptidase n=1 Tax=Clostridium folliculivorans TaxID=2886038 RepID=A0A9W5Y4M0_9CLOT|nr:pyroglutamyl-peptidase I [Clostridium folliculivorans]GKU26646.1 pyrrolidone-carboxylate peptidase [Clostridium folliculivorans]GKU28922.1 pyrrolidone-carboxylate peptidase [Clostridium folliculivorans]
MKVLVTGFTPFGVEAINPSFEAVQALSDKIAQANIITLEIPTVFHESIEILDKAIEINKPDIVICVGQAGGRFDITVERVAINIDDARIEDNKGNQPIDEPIFSDGQPAYFANVPIKSMVEKIRESGIPASVSNSAGTFVCNHIMYGLMYLIDKKYSKVRGTFIHVPFIPQQVVDKYNAPSMELSMISKALGLAIEAAIGNRGDIKAALGSIC